MKDKIIEIAKELRYQMQAVQYAIEHTGISEADLKSHWNDLSDIATKLDKLDSLYSGGMNKEYPFKCNKCGFEFTSDDLGHTYLTCTQPFSQRTSGICGGIIELNYPIPDISKDKPLDMSEWPEGLRKRFETAKSDHEAKIRNTGYKEGFEAGKEFNSISEISEEEIEKFVNANYFIDRHREICKESIKWVITKGAQPEIAHCTQCGYHYDSLLKECPTCKGAKPMTEERIEGMAKIYNNNQHDAFIVATICDEILDKTGALLGEIRKIARKELNNK